MTEKKKQDTVWKRRYQKGMFLVCLLLFTVCAFRYVARADVYLLNGSSARVFVGETFVVSDYFVQDEAEKILQESLRYAVSEESGSRDCITLAADGTVTALAEGTAVIDVTYQLAEDQSERTESFYVTVMSPETVNVLYGEKIWLSVFDLYNPYTNPDTWEGGGKAYSYAFSNDSVVLDDDREGLMVQGFHDVDVYLVKGSDRFLVAKIIINLPEFKQKELARATGTDAFYPELLNCKSDSYSDYEDDVIYLAEPVWSVENEKIVTLSESGFSAKAKGTTKINAEFNAKNGDTLKLTLAVTVTDPKLKNNRLVMAVGVVKKAPVSGTCSYSTYSSEKSALGGSTQKEDADAAGSEYRYSYLTQAGKFSGLREGTEKILFYVDGREFAITLVITNPRYNNNTFTMYKGLKKTLPILGLSKKYSTISYTSAKPNVASITKTGNVTAKKVGNVKLKIKADGKTFYVWVEIATKKAYQAAKKEIAISKTKTQYSQVKRMLKGYYDCSSLVSRVYRKFGVYFGSKSGWSPTAAGIGQWCSSHHKVIANKAVDYTKLVPGDLVFYSYTKNGRYKNISHIEMYVGNGMNVSASSSRNAVVHYGYGTGSIVMIARPLK